MNTFTEPGGRVTALEQAWPVPGILAPHCAADGCRRRAVYIYHVGVNAVASYCQVHGQERIERNAQRGTP